MPLIVHTSTRRIRIARGGTLLPWLGPAMRGLTGGRLRSRTCRQPVWEQISRWTNCAGCPLMQGCGFGELYEPDLPEGVELQAGWESATRPLVIAPGFPLHERVATGYYFPLRVLFIGTTAMNHIAAFWESVRLGGADLAIGLGNDHILYDVLEGDEPDQTCGVQLPLQPTKKPEMVKAVRVELTSPLFLTYTDERKKKRPLLRPTFGDLVRAGLRVIGPLHRLHTTPLPEELFGQVKEAAKSVPTIAEGFEEFEQGKWSNRTKEHFDLRGATGWAIYGPVPAWLVPWLAWAGKLHVGTHRVAGAGGWIVKQQEN